MKGLQIFGPWRIAEVRRSLDRRRLIYINRMNPENIPHFVPAHTAGYAGTWGNAPLVRMGRNETSIIQALCGHEGDGAGAGADVEKIAVGRKDGHGRTEKYAVGIHLHRTSLVYDLKPLETECTHYIMNLLYINELTVDHIEGAVAHCGELGIMGHDDDGLAVLVAEVEEETVEFGLGL